METILGYANVITASIVAFLSTVKPGLIGYFTFESYRAYRGVIFTLQGYLIRFIITLGLLYFAQKVVNDIGYAQDQLMFLAGSFSFIILDILEKRVPSLLEKKIDDFINKK